MSTWRPALRIARRTVVRSPGRSLLISLLVALPVAGATYADVVARTFSSPQLQAQHILGAADGAVTITPQTRLADYDPRWLAEPFSTATGHRRDPASVDVASVLPSGTRIAAMPRFQPVEISSDRGIVRTRILLGDVRQPLQGFLLEGASGSRLPRAGEVLVTRSLAKRLDLLNGDGHLRSDAAIDLVNGPSARVAGFARDPSCLSCEQIVAPPSSPIVHAAAQRSPSSGYAYDVQNADPTSYPTYLVDLPAATDTVILGRKLAAEGIALTTRAALAHPLHAAGGSVSAGGLVALIAALGLLEVVLLAGAAFAVGARRQVRELGLIAATGGSGRDIRRIVLAQAVVLSSFGAVLGIGVGAAVAVAGRTRWEQLANTDIAGWAFDPNDIAGAGLAGVLSGLVAAIVPALGAGRMRPVDALAARFRADDRPRRQSAVVGAVSLAAGIGFGLVADHELAGGYDGYKRALVGAAITGRDIQPPSAAGPTHLIIIGATLAIIGLAILTPALIGRIAAFGPRLPLSARLAVRDADRHRHRTGPAMGAIVVVVTGSVALALLLASSFHAKQLTDPPSLPPQTLEIQNTGSPATTSTAAGQAAAQLSHGRRRTVSIPYVPGKRPIPGRPNADAWTLSVARQNFSCPPHLPAGVCSPIAIPPGGPLAIGGDDATISLLAYPGLNAAARRALGRGRVLVFDATMLDHSSHVHIATPDGSVQLPGTLVPRTRTYRLLPAGLVSAATAHTQGWAIASDAVLVTYDSHTTRGQIGAAVTAAQQAGAVVLRNSGPNKPVNLILSLIAAVAAFTTFVGVAVSTALSVAESRADLATLAAIGAPPARRRAFTASQALLIGGLGSMLGTTLGAFIAFTARTTTGSPRLVVPWPQLATTAIGVPLLAAVVATACTPRRAPMLRRAE